MSGVRSPWIGGPEQPALRELAARRVDRRRDAGAPPPANRGGHVGIHLAAKLSGPGSPASQIRPCSSLSPGDLRSRSISHSAYAASDSRRRQPASSSRHGGHRVAARDGPRRAPAARRRSDLGDTRPTRRARGTNAATRCAREGKQDVVHERDRRRRALDVEEHDAARRDRRDVTVTRRRWTAECTPDRSTAAGNSWSTPVFV